MKKTTKKLVLARETVRRLGELDGLMHVAGGRRVTVASGCDFCPTDISYTSCNTCDC
jgi:hypothetical protein